MELSKGGMIINGCSSYMEISSIIINISFNVLRISPFFKFPITLSIDSDVSITIKFLRSQTCLYPDNINICSNAMSWPGIHFVLNEGSHRCNVLWHRVCSKSLLSKI